MQTTILHLSDLHFGDPKAVLHREDLYKLMESLLEKAGAEVILVLSGDVSFKGKIDGYREAHQAFQKFLERGQLSRELIVVCPGNHDIVKLSGGISPFETFDAWSAGLRYDKSCTFSSNPCRIVKCGIIDFLVLNSAYHGEHSYGLVDLNQLDEVLSTISRDSEPGRLRVAVLHHHLIPFSGRLDESTTRNAYPLLTKLVEYGFSLVLHGHQHALLELKVGSRSMMLCGVGSFRYSTPGFVNSAAIFRIDGQGGLHTEQYAVSKDSPNFLRQLTTA